MKKIRLFKSFNEANKIYIKGLVELRKKISSFSFGGEITIQIADNFIISYKKNFFTLLILSLLIECDISKERIKSYGKIIFAIREIVTATDNIIDKEEKSSIGIKGIKEKTTKNIFSILLQEHIIHREIIALDGKTEDFIKLLDEIYEIGKSEGLRDRNLYKNYPTYDEIEKNIHSGIGGKLLEIALLLPSILENNLKLMNYKEGLYEIGMALQALDDFTDIEEDNHNSKVNLAYVHIFENNLDKKEYLENIKKRAFKGFKILENNGYPIDEKIARHLLEILFHIRGIDKKILF